MNPTATCSRLYWSTPVPPSSFRFCVAPAVVGYTCVSYYLAVLIADIADACALDWSFVAEGRAQMAATGACEIPAFVRADAMPAFVEDARQIVGPAALQDDWAMTNAIEAGQGGEALRQLAMMIEAGAPPEKILGQLGWLVRSKFPSVAPAELPAAVEAVFRTDLALKRSAGDARVLLERLVVELCAGKRSRGGGGARRY